MMKINNKLALVIIVLLLGWLLVIFLLTRTPLHSNQLELLKKQNKELTTLLDNIRYIEVDGKQIFKNLTYPHMLNKLKTVLNRTDGYDIKEKTDQLLDTTIIKSEESYKGVYEVERLYRRIYVGVKEMWYYTISELKKLRSLSKDRVVKKSIGQILEDGAEHKRTLFATLHNLSMANGRMEWVRKEIKDLEEIVERRLTALQNPSNCDTAKKIVCDLSNFGCGYGCQLHLFVHCFIMAYGTQRTMILRSKGWRYNKDGFESIFQPLSNTCVSDYGITHGSWPPAENDIQVLLLPHVDDVILPIPPFVPLAIPKDLSERLMTVHGNPSVWWIAQFVKYMMRPNKSHAQFLRDFMNKMDFQKPIVGVQVRRTDKVGTEADYHSIEEYMYYVKNYYDTLALRQNVSVRRVYLASDDPSVYEDAKRKFPDYLFLGDPEMAKSAATSGRYSSATLLGVAGNIHLLASTDYLVCTFSSNLGRLAYEIMQTLNPDASANVQSLDNLYWFYGQLPHTQAVLYNHNPGNKNGQIEMRVGDVIELEENTLNHHTRATSNYDGYSRGLNRRTNQSGFFPAFKTEDLIFLFELNDYKE